MDWVFPLTYPQVGALELVGFEVQDCHSSCHDSVSL